MMQDSETNIIVLNTALKYKIPIGIGSALWLGLRYALPKSDLRSLDFVVVRFFNEAVQKCQ